MSLIDQIIDSLSELYVQISYTAHVVCGQLQGYLGVLDADIWMMLRLLGDLADVVYEVDPVHEFLKFKHTDDVFLLRFPLGASLEGSGEFSIF